VPSVPVKPCTIILEFLLTRTDMVQLKIKNEKLKMAASGRWAQR